MLPVNIAHGHEATVSPFSVAVKRQAIASTVYSSTGTGENTIYYLLFEIQKIPHSILGTTKYYLKIARDSLFIE